MLVCLNDENEKSSSESKEILKEFYTSLNVTPNLHTQFPDIYDYANIKKQIDIMQKIHFGTKINVLFITDRLYGCAKGLQEYMKNSDDISVDIINCYENAKQIILQKSFDFLIIVGHLSNKDNYEIIRYIAKYNEYISVIIYAADSLLIKSVCLENYIEYKYDRMEPVDGFIEYMRQCYNIETAKLQHDYPLNTTKEQLRFAVIEKEKIKEQLREQAETKQKEKERRNKILKNIGMAAVIIFMFCFIIFGFFYWDDYIINQKPIIGLTK